MATKQEKAKKVAKMLTDHKTTMFVTHGKEGGLVSRPMTTQKPKFDGDVWFFVSSDAEVIAEVEANAEVNIAYSIENNYLSISGTASMVDDVEKKKELWYPELEQWFNGEGPESPHVRLIKVSANTARYWDISKSRSKKDESPIDTEMVKY
jgi:general stress protein 26